MPELVVAAEVCEDLWAPNPPSISHALAGATVIVNLSASNAIVGKAAYRRALVAGQSARLVCGYVYTSAGWGESTTDVVFAGHDMVAENGTLLAESAPFASGNATTEIDVSAIAGARLRMSTFRTAVGSVDGAGPDYFEATFELDRKKTELTRHVDPHPFVPADGAERDARCEDVFTIQAWGKYDIVKDELDFTVRFQLLRNDSFLAKLVRPVTFPFTKLLLEFKVTGSVDEPQWQYISVIDRIL
jgi:NAD+ synthase (glutamine-hydrolysing)